MWNTFLERGKELAEKAKAAAETIDKQIDATVGLDSDGGTTVTDDLSAGLKGASSLLFGRTSDRNGSGGGGNSSHSHSQTNNVSTEYLSQRESIGFVAGLVEDDDDDEDAWGDDDDIVIPDDSSHKPPAKGEAQNLRAEEEEESTTAPSLQRSDGFEETSNAASATGSQDAFRADKMESIQLNQPVEHDHLDDEEMVSSSQTEPRDPQHAWSEFDDGCNDAVQQMDDYVVEEEPTDLASQSTEEANAVAAESDTGQAAADPHDAASLVPDSSCFVEQELPSVDQLRDETDDDEMAAQDEPPIEESDALEEPVESVATADECAGPNENGQHAQVCVADGGDEATHAPARTEETPSPSHDERPPAAKVIAQPPPVEDENLAPVPDESLEDPPVLVEPVDVLSATAVSMQEAAERDGPSVTPGTHGNHPFVKSPAELHDQWNEPEPDSLSRQNAAGTSAPQQHDGSSSSSSLQLQQELESQREITRLLEERLDQVTTQLRQREDQLVGKTSQLSMLQSEWDAERNELQAKLQATKDEAKRRIQKAKERVDAAEAKLKAVSSDDAQQAEVIAALRSEGERLAIKQSEMEKAVRAAKGESRQLREQVEDESQRKEEALAKIQKLEADLKDTRDKLASARRGESQADKLENELAAAREDLERKGSTILSLEQELKERNAEIKELAEELDNARAGAAIDSQLQQEKLMKHHEESVKDLELKLRTSEREAAIREDALRHEVDELRKRWQDAVRRADTLSMDIQSSTAPLMRQLESAERQGRIRAAAAAEIETKLRSELEETVVANEKLSKESSELHANVSRLERRTKEAEEELQSARAALENKAAVAKQLEERIQNMETESARLKQEWAEVERLANEGVTRVRSELTQTMVESEERHLSQVEALKADLAREREKVELLEVQLKNMLDTIGLNSSRASQPSIVSLQEAEPQRLRKSVGQAEILAGALGFDDERDDDLDDVDVDDILGEPVQGDSFAAIEELSSRLKAAQVELLELKRSLSNSEESRNHLAEELGESRIAKEKLPLFEAKVRELTAENEEQALEIMGLREDIDEVRELYRAQLNMLLEEKARLVKDQLNEENGIRETEPSDGPPSVEREPDGAADDQ
jgi:predicted  nucleic acid-binding Zn-ribbon protein